MRDTLGYVPAEEREIPPETKEQAELDSKKIEKFRDGARRMLEILYSATNTPEIKLHLNAGPEQMVRDLLPVYAGFSKEDYKQAAPFFLEALIDFVAEKSRDPKQAEQFHRFLENIEQTFFSYSPNISNQAGIENLLVMTAKANRVSEAQGWFGQKMVGELVYELRFCEEPQVEKIIEKIKTLPVEDAMDVAHQLQTVGANAVAQGKWAELAVDRSNRILQTLSAHPSPLVKYQAELALNRLHQEEREPSLSVVTYHGNQAGGRLGENLARELSEEDHKLARQINPDMTVGDGKLVYMAKDAIGILDHSNLPHAIAKIQQEKLQKPIEVSLRALRNTEDLLTGDRLKSAADWSEVMSFINHRILKPYKYQSLDPKELAGQWHQISPVFSKMDWQEFFALQKDRDDFQDNVYRMKGQIHIEAEAKNEALSQQFIEKFEALAPQILKLDLGPRSELLAEEFEEFLKQKQAKNLERTFTSAERFVSDLDPDVSQRYAEVLNRASGLSPSEEISEEQRQRTQKLISDVEESTTALQAVFEKYSAIQDLVKSFENLKNQHIQTWRKAQEEQNQLYNLENKPEMVKSLQEYSRILNHLMEDKQFDLSQDILIYLRKLDKELSQQLVPVHFSAYENLEGDREVNPFANIKEQNLPLLLRHLHHPELREKIEEDLGISLRDIPLRSQIHLLRFLADQDQEGFNRLRTVLENAEGFKTEFLQTFVVTAEDPSYGAALLTLAERLSAKPKVAEKVFAACNDYMERAYQNAQSILGDLRQEYPNLDLSDDMIVQALISRGKDFLVELNQEADRGKPLPKLVNEFVAELTHRPFQEQVVRASFKSLAELLHRERIDLSKLERQQALVLESLLKNSEQKQITMRTLSRMGKLETIPEIHWRVDRSLEEYNRRLGLNLGEFLKDRGQIKPKQKLLEIGPGSGIGRQERIKDLEKLYLDMALADKIYYPLTPVIERLFDYSRLEQETGETLTLEDRKLLVDFVYKAMVIAKGETGKDQFSYNEQLKKELASDINNLKTVFPQTAELLKLADVVPEQRSIRNKTGEVTYPYKVRTAEQSTSFQKAKRLLDQNFTAYLRSDWQEIDYHGLIEAFPPNVMVGDLDDIKRLSPNQIDVELAVRSTVYATGEKYQEFLKNLTAVLADGGVAVDDSIRENDGWAYRVGEILQAKKAMKTPLEVLVVLGPGFPGQDQRQDMVPLSMLMTKNGSSRELVEKHLGPDCRIVSVEDLAEDQEYLRTLDASGLTLEKVKQIS